MTPSRLAQVCHDTADRAGVGLVFDPGWEVRGHGRTRPTWRAVLLHDTVTPHSWSRAQLTRLLRDGHGNLPGPIANLQLERDGSLVVIAAGRAYHAGSGRDPIGAGIQSGNLHTLGVEAANAGGGSGERWTDAQIRTALALCQTSGLPALGHKEWATGRKQDPWSVDMPTFRAAPHHKETPMPTDELAVQVRRLADAQHANAQAAVAPQVASIRAGLGLDSDPHSDAIWAVRVAAGTHTLEQAAAAIAGRA